MKIKKYNYPLGITSRICVSIVNDESFDKAGDSPENLVRYWREIIATQADHEPDKESVVVVLLNTRLRAYAWNRVSLGSVSESTAHPREILRPVICGGAYGFVLMHNHPSGDTSPSRADEAVTKRIVEASALMQVRLLDHIIIGHSSPSTPGYYSFREVGLIP